MRSERLKKKRRSSQVDAYNIILSLKTPIMYEADGIITAITKA